MGEGGNAQQPAHMHFRLLPCCFSAHSIRKQLVKLCAKRPFLLFFPPTAAHADSIGGCSKAIVLTPIRFPIMMTSSRTAEYCQHNAIHDRRTDAVHEHRSGDGKHLCRRAEHQALTFKFQRLALPTELLNPVIGTKVPAPACLASFSYTCSPVSRADSAMSVIDTAVPASLSSSPAICQKTRMPCPNAQMPPPTANAHSMFFPSGDFPQLRCIIWLYCSGVGCMSIPPFLCVSMRRFPAIHAQKSDCGNFAAVTQTISYFTAENRTILRRFSRTPSTSNPLSYRALPSPSKHPVRHRIPVPRRKWY